MHNGGHELCCDLLDLITILEVHIICNFLKHLRPSLPQGFRAGWLLKELNEGGEGADGSAPGFGGHGQLCEGRHRLLLLSRAGGVAPQHADELVAGSHGAAHVLEVRRWGGG